MNRADPLWILAVLNLAPSLAKAECATIGPTVTYQGTSYVTRMCGNDAEAAIYAAANPTTQVSTMTTTNSWFACYVHGARHAGNNDIWYLTKGDSPNVWGYMPAISVHVNNDPIPHLVACKSQPTGVLDVPFVAQKPELPNGCEVTSLTMLLKFAGVNVDKMTLASEVDKVPWWVDESQGIHGNPNDGFVGEMKPGKPGYGVFHAPIERLAERYLPGRVVKLTGKSFDEVLTQHVGQGRAVWVITNMTWAPLANSALEIWKTTSEEVLYTRKEHSVVLTGFDNASVYINDPFDDAGKNKKLDRAKFRAAWEQMGSQAVTYAPRSDSVRIPESP